MHITARVEGKPGQTFTCLSLLDMESVLMEVWRSNNRQPFEVVLGEHSFVWWDRVSDTLLSAEPDKRLIQLRAAYEKDCRKAQRAKASKKIK